MAAIIDAEVGAATTRYDDLRVVVLNGTLKRSPEPSHTDGLLSVTRRVLEGVGARVDVVRLVDHVVCDDWSPSQIGVARTRTSEGSISDR